MKLMCIREVDKGLIEKSKIEVGEQEDVLQGIINDRDQDLLKGTNPQLQRTKST